MAKAEGTIWCPVCGKNGVPATVVIRETRARSELRYPKHGSASGHTSKRCEKGTIQYGSDLYPQWAKRAVQHLPRG